MYMLSFQKFQGERAKLSHLYYTILLFLLKREIKAVYMYLTNRQQFSIVYNLIDQRNDVEIFKTKVKPWGPAKWFHCKVLNIF